MFNVVENGKGVKWDVSLLLLVDGDSTLAKNPSEMVEASQTQELDTHKVPKAVGSCVDTAMTLKALSFSTWRCGT